MAWQEVDLIERQTLAVPELCCAAEGARRVPLCVRDARALNGVSLIQCP